MEDNGEEQIKDGIQDADLRKLMSGGINHWEGERRLGEKKIMGVCLRHTDFEVLQQPSGHI